MFEDLFSLRFVFKNLDGATGRIESREPVLQPPVSGLEQREQLAATLPKRNTNEELEAKLVKKRGELKGNDFEVFVGVDDKSDKLQILAGKVKEAILLQQQINIGAYRGDSDFEFTYKSKKVTFSEDSGENNFLYFSVGDNRYSIDLNRGDITRNNSVKEESITPDLVINDLAFVIEGEKYILSEKPRYRRIKSDSPDAISNDGLNVRNDDGSIIGKVPLSSYVQVVGDIDRKGYVSIYFIDDSYCVRFGKVSAKYLDSEDLDSYEKNAQVDRRVEKVIDTMVVTSSAGNEGLKLRSAPYTEGSDIYGRIPVGTVLDVMEKTSAGGEQQWARVKYKDASDKIKEGWACIYQANTRYLDKR